MITLGKREKKEEEILESMWNNLNNRENFVRINLLFEKELVLLI